MWNQIQTDEYEGMLAETVTVPGNNGRRWRVYSRPLGKGPYPGLVLIPHAPGWDEWCRETVRRFSQHGYSVACPDIFRRFGDGTPSEVAQWAREAGGVPDADVMADCGAALRFLASQPNANGQVGVIGIATGRHASWPRAPCPGCGGGGCWGGGVVALKET